MRIFADENYITNINNENFYDFYIFVKYLLK